MRNFIVSSPLLGAFHKDTTMQSIAMENEARFIESWLESVHSNDRVYITGAVVANMYRAKQILKELPGKITVLYSRRDVLTPEYMKKLGWYVRQYFGDTITVPTNGNYGDIILSVVPACSGELVGAPKYIVNQSNIVKRRLKSSGQHVNVHSFLGTERKFCVPAPKNTALRTAEQIMEEAVEEK